MQPVVGGTALDVVGAGWQTARAVVDQQAFQMDLIPNTHVVDAVPHPLVCGNEMIIGQVIRRKEEGGGHGKPTRPRVTPVGHLLEIIPGEVGAPNDTEVFGVHRRTIMIDIGHTMDIIMAHD